MELAALLKGTAVGMPEGASNSPTAGRRHRHVHPPGATQGFGLLGGRSCPGPREEERGQVKAGCREEPGAELCAAGQGLRLEGLKSGLQLGPISIRDTDWKAK